ncbi:GntR family transcriptional regulator [Crenobacter luteus]|uniref:FadR/GntR family transcriptional regulator n=1 Tax=Crenobacter luteus TaxID=1452487 RepID=UPI00104B0299|nr:FCD domain-containing protein [Crenobacter luteus]TCP15199.1 GntR family transcriptional regulator [Crenobacter luteus]
MPFNAISPPPRRRLSDMVYEQLETMIVDGLLKPGDELPSERELAERMSVSRPPVREALHKLESRGLISPRAEGGYLVANPGEALVADPLTQLLARHPKAVADVFELRHGLESLSVRLAAERATDADLARLRAAIDEMEATHRAGDAGAAQKLPELDARFHLLVAEASHNVALVHVMQAIHELVESAIARNYRQMDGREADIAQMISQHRGIYDAIAAHDAQAGVGALDAHLNFIRDRLG